MIHEHIGEICALAAAMSWAGALILFKLSGDSIPPLALSLFKNVVAIVLLVATLPFAAGGAVELLRLPPIDLLVLAASGILGIAIADTLLFYSLNAIGVGLLTITECFYTPAVVLLAWALLAERMESHHYAGGALVVVGMVVSSTHRAPADRTRRQLIGGLLLGACSVVLMAFGIVAAKPILEEADLIAASLWRLLAGTIVLAVFTLARSDRAVLFSVFKPSPNWRYSLSASALGTYLAMVFWIAGYKYARASIAAILNQTSSVMALILATIILKEPFTKRKAAAALLALIGVAMITIGGGAK